MAQSISERIAELRKEIAEIQSANHMASVSLPCQDREELKQRREKRLEEIKQELGSLASKKF